MESFAILVVASLLFAFSNALTVGRFDNLTSAIWDEWNKDNPENLKDESIRMVYGNDNLILVGPTMKGGMVSTLRTSDLAWSHKPYTRFDEEKYNKKLFSLNGTLFMLTYSTDAKKIDYRKLYFWNDDGAGQWLATPFEIDPSASTLSNNSIQWLTVTVPDQDGTTAYFVASAHGYNSAESEMAYSRLDVEFRGNEPIKATLKSIARVRSDHPSSVFFAAVKDDILYAFVDHFYSEGFVPEYDFAYTIDLKTGQSGNVTLSGARPPMYYDDERIFQTKDEIMIVTGYRVYGLAQIQNVKDIWSLNLDTFQWHGTNALVPDDIGATFAFDQDDGKLYVAGAKEGVSVAQVSP